MNRHSMVSRLVAVPVALALSSVAAFAQSPVGSAAVTGPVRVDGQNVTGTVQVNNAARLSTGDEASVSMSLARGGEVKLAGQADIVATTDAIGPRIQVVCGEVNLLNTGPATIVSANGARVFARAGKVVVTQGTKTTVVKKGKTKDFDGGLVVAVSEPGSDVVVKSNVACDCNCGNTGRP